MSDKTERILKSLEKLEKVRTSRRVFGTFLFLFSLGLALHARSKHLELELPIGLFDGGIHNGYTLVFGPAVILIVAVAAFFQWATFLKLKKEVQKDIASENMTGQLTHVEDAELNGRRGFLAFLSEAGPFLGAALFAITITWVFGDFQYPRIRVADHPVLAEELSGEESEFADFFKPYVFRAEVNKKKEPLKITSELINKDHFSMNKKDNWSLLFFGVGDDYKAPYSPWHERVSLANYATTPSIDHWQAIGHLLSTVTVCFIAIWVSFFTARTFLLSAEQQVSDKGSASEAPQTDLAE